MQRNIVITGVSGGLGYVLTEKLLQQRYHVIGLSRGNRPEVLEKLKKIALENGSTFVNFKADFEEVHSLKTQLNSRLKLLDPSIISHVIITHGTNFNAPLHRLDIDTIEKSMRINFIGPFLLSQYFMKHWEAFSKRGKKTDRSIVYISSVAAKGGAPEEVAYHSAKRAMESAMLSISRQGASFGIRANVVSPGLMDTSMGEETAKNRPDVLKRIPLGRLTGVTEVSQAVLFLLESPSTTGQNIHINGGRHPTI